MKVGCLRRPQHPDGPSGVDIFSFYSGGTCRGFRNEIETGTITLRNEIVVIRPMTELEVVIRTFMCGPDTPEPGLRSGGARQMQGRQVQEPTTWCSMFGLPTTLYPSPDTHCRPASCGPHPAGPSRKLDCTNPPTWRKQRPVLETCRERIRKSYPINSSCRGVIRRESASGPDAMELNEKKKKREISYRTSVPPAPGLHACTVP